MFVKSDPRHVVEIKKPIKVWRPGLVEDTWLWDQEVLSSSPGCDRSTFSPQERLFTCISSPHSCVERVMHHL